MISEEDAVIEEILEAAVKGDLGQWVDWRCEFGHDCDTEVMADAQLAHAAMRNDKDALLRAAYVRGFWLLDELRRQVDLAQRRRPTP